LPVPELAALAVTYRVIVLPYRGARANTLMPAKFWNSVAARGWVVSLGLETPDLPTVRPTQSTESFVAAVLECLETGPEHGAIPAPNWRTRWEQMLEVLDSVPTRRP
jgi:hypothetical protein